MENRRSMLLSTAGVVFGVGFFVCGQAITEGFQNFFIDTILGSKGAVIVSDRFRTSFIQKASSESLIHVNRSHKRDYIPGIYDSYRMIDTLMTFRNVKSCTPIVEGKSVIQAGFRNGVATVFGIDLDYHVEATDFEDQFIKGSLEDFRRDSSAVVVGSLLAGRMEVKRGQAIYLSDFEGNKRRFNVVGISETGVNAIDDKRVYVHRRSAQQLMDKAYQTSFIMVQLHNPQKARSYADHFEDLLSHRSRAWQDREKANLQIFQALRLFAGLVIACILMLAGFGIFNVLTMTVLEKTKEIAILRSMGYTRGDIAAIFLWQGLFVAIIGIIVGWVVGAGLALGVESIPIKVRGIFKADHFVVAWELNHYMMGAVLALFSVVIASYIPASRAARMKPVNVLRGSSN